MNLTNYKEVSNYEIVRILDKKIELSLYQKEKLQGVDFYPFKIVKPYFKEKIKPIWRTTILFYFLYLLLLTLIIVPIKWMFTGDKYFKDKNKLYVIYKYWTNKIGF